MKRGLIAGILALLAAAAMAQSASGATLTGDYRFQGTLTSSGPGPALTPLGAGVGAFAPDSVMGVTRKVLPITLHGGLKMAPAGIPSFMTPYSVVMTFRLDKVTDYNRLIDHSNSSEDNGLYVHNGKVDLYVAGPGSQETATAVIAPGSWATVVLLQKVQDIGSAVYLNGARVVLFSGSFNDTTNSLIFFKDEVGGIDDASGAVSCIRTFQGLLTDEEIAAIGASPTCGGPPDPPPAARKCKKKKKHGHHAAAAKKHKKKCKKKKRRK